MVSNVICNERNEPIIPAHFKRLVSHMDSLRKSMMTYTNKVHFLTARYLDYIIESQGTSDIKSKHDYADIIEAVESYHNCIQKYKSALTDDLFEFAAPNDQADRIAALYKHHLVVQILYDIQPIRDQLQILSDYQQIYGENDYLLTRWHAELTHFLEFEC